MSSIGNFVHDDEVGDGVEVEERPMIKLENNAVYIGQWGV
jgi:hypothetical protein